MACGTARLLLGLNLPKSPFIEIIITNNVEQAYGRYRLEPKGMQWVISF